MKNSHRRLVAFALAATMVFGSTLTVLADDTDATTQQTATGQGHEQYINKEVYKINIPTTERMSDIFDYYVDPQGLIKETAGGLVVSGQTLATENIPIDDSSVLFVNKNDEGKVTGLSAASDVLSIKNKGSVGVKLAIDVAYDGSASYAGDYSSTYNFADSDSTKGLFIGLIASNEPFLGITSGSGIVTTNAVISAADKYATTVSGGAYSYDLIANATDFPSYDFQLYATLNKDMPEDTWATRINNNVTAKTYQAVKVKFTPSAIRETLPADVYVTDAVVMVKKHVAPESDGGFGEAKPTAITINSKTVDASKATMQNGYVVINKEDVVAAWGLTASSKDGLGADATANIMSYVKSVSITPNGSTQVYYGEVK